MDKFRNSEMNIPTLTRQREAKNVPISNVCNGFNIINYSLIINTKTITCQVSNKK